MDICPSQQKADTLLFMGMSLLLFCISRVECSVLIP
jgi:hypothetical protein